MSTIWEVAIPEETEQDAAETEQNAAETEQDAARDLNYFRVQESTALLRAIFPNYPDLNGMKPIPESQAFLRTLRTESCRTLAESA